MAKASIFDALGEDKLLNCCRLCLSPLESQNMIFIDDKIKNDFFAITNLQLISSLEYSAFSCESCIEKLSSIIVTKNEFIEVQNQLYSKFALTSTIKVEEEEARLIQVENVDFQQFDKSNFPDDNFEEEPIEQEVPIRTRRKSNYKEKVQIRRKKRIKKLQKTTPKVTLKVDKSKVTISCPDCGLVLKMGSLQKHRKNMHLRQKNFICDHCNRAFFLKTRLLNHLRSHFQIKPFKCPLCDWRFTSAGALFSHKKKVHEKAYTRCCHLCGKEFSCKTLFDTHMRSSHTGERPFLCDLEGCEQRFFSAAELAVHKKGKHSEQDPVQCEICNKSLKYQKLLRIHMKIHQERKFVCEFNVDDRGKCGKRFITNHLLNNHIKLSHLGLKRFECQSCNMKFSVKIDLENHVRNIHELRKIKCELCQTLLGDKTYYQRHVKNHHKDLPPEIMESLIFKIKNTRDDDLFNYRK